jgi:hypothetical protein
MQSIAQDGGTMFQVPEQYRIMTGEFATSFSAGNNGAFLFKFRGYEVFCIASDGLGW